MTNRIRVFFCYAGKFTQNHLTFMIRDRLAHYFRAGYAGVYIRSFEEGRVETELLRVCQAINYSLYVWTVTTGLTGPMGTEKDPVTIAGPDGPLSPIEILKKIGEKGGLPEQAVIMAKDYHLFTADANPFIIRELKDALGRAREFKQRFVITGCEVKLCAELQKEMTVVDFDLPARDELKEILDRLASDAKVKLNGNVNPILDAATGMSTTEAADAFALAVIESNGMEISPTVVSREKSMVVKKGGVLELVSKSVQLSDIGGLEVFKRDLHSKRNLFTQDARDYGLKAPRGSLLCGQAGTGKSIIAQACGAVFNIPMLRLEAGRIYSSLVGSSEANWRSAFATAKAIAPCVVWIDEAEALFSGAKSSGQTDGGTTTRVIKAALQDMSEAEGIYFILTANDIDGFPDALIDRLDVWNVELPTMPERLEIWRIHLAKRKRDWKKFNCAEFAYRSDGYSGRQIEQMLEAAMCNAFNEAARETTNEDVFTVIAESRPTSLTMAKQIQERQERLKGKARSAGIEVPESATKRGRKLSV